jgi:NTE family protein
MKKFLTILSLTLWLAVATALAQKAPKVSLTLSGGGAKGLAHIGILKAIDSAGLRIDLLTGTSMGSIVAGAYAAGYSADSIEIIARNLDWKTLLSNMVSMRSFIMEEKSEYGKYAIELPIKDKALKLPKGFLESQELWMKLEEIFFPVHDIKNFDKLSIPFRCVATDLATGKPKVFSSGNLVTAIRASMAIPGVFSPVDLDGHRYVDGAVVRNFPVKDALDMGAEYTIGVSVSQPVKNAAELDDATKVLGHVIFINEEKDRQEEAKLCNILIEVPIGDFSSGSFAKADDIVDLGIETGRKFYPAFKKLADSLRTLEPGYAHRSQRLPVTAQYTFNAIEVKGIKKSMHPSFMEQVNAQTNAPYTAQDLIRRSRNAYAYRMYNSITYDVLPDSTGGRKLLYDVKPDPSGIFKAAINYNTFAGISLTLNATARNLLSPFSRSLLSVSIGDNFRGMAEHLQMFGYRNPLSNRTQVYVELQELPTYDADFNRTGLYKQRYYLIDNQFLNSGKRKWSAGLGVRWEYLQAVPEIQKGLYFDGRNHFLSAYTQFAYNTLDKPFFASKGTKIDIWAGYVFGLKPSFNFYIDDNFAGDLNTDPIDFGNYARLLGKIDHTAPISNRLAGILKAQACINFGPKSSLLNNFTLGGMNYMMRNQAVFAGPREGQIITESLSSLLAGLRWRVVSDLYATISANAAVYDFVSKTSFSTATSWIGGGGLTLGYNLPIGPLEWTVMYTPKVGGVHTYINIGFPFKTQ